MTPSPRIRVAVAAAAVTVLTAACGIGPAPTPQAGSHSATEAPGAGSDLADLSWLSARAIETNDVTTAVELALVRADGSVPWQSTLALDHEMPGGLVIAGPRAGMFVHGQRDGAQVVFSAVRAADGSVAEIGRVDGKVVGAALDPTAGSLYVAVTDDSLRIMRLPLEGGELDELHEMPIDGRLPLTWNRLHITPDGAVLVLEDCIADDCTWTTMRVADGGLGELHADAGALVDLSNDTLLARSNACPAGPCPFLLIDLDSGEARPWDPHAHEARLAVAEDGRTLLLHDRQGQGGAGPVTVTDPATQDELRVRPTDPSGIELGLARVGQDSWVPSGWALLAQPGSNLGELGGPTLMRLVDGTLRHLPAPNLP